MQRPTRYRLAAIALLAVLVLVLPWIVPAAQREAVTTPEEPPPAPARSAAVNPWLPPGAVPASAIFYERFETITTADGLPSDRVTCVLVEGERLWAGTDKGLAVREQGAWRTLTPAKGLAHGYVTSVARDDVAGDLWISTLGGLSRLTGEHLQTYTQRNSGLMNDVVYHVVAGDGLVWAATAAGTSCYDVRAGTWALYDHENSIMHEPGCYAAALGPGRTWIGVWGGGIVERDRATGRWRAYRDPDGEMEIDLMRDDGPIHDVTSFIAYDAGVLWQSTYFGLSRYDGRRWRSYLQEDTGLPGDFINHVTARGHTAWLSTDQGLGVFDGSTCVTYRRRDDGACDVLVTRDGKLAEQRTLSTAPAHNYILWAYAGPRDVWLATGKGLTHGIAPASERRGEANAHERKK